MFRLLTALFIIPVILGAQGAAALLISQKRAGGATSDYGEPTSAGATLQSGVDIYTLFTPFTTGANPGGYSLTALKVYSGANGGKIYTALYSNSTSCTNGSNCPNTSICNEATGATASANAFTTLTPSGCGTLAASTSYWIMHQSDNASREAAYHATNCPAPLAFTSASDFKGGETPPSTPASTDAAQSSNCYVQYVTLTAL